MLKAAAIPGHSERPSCKRNQAPSAIESTVTEKMTKASAKRPCEDCGPGMPSCCAMCSQAPLFFDSSWLSIPAARLHAQPGWPDYHQLSQRGRKADQARLGGACRRGLAWPRRIEERGRAA